MLASLFVNDFQIGYRHSALSVIGSKLQQFFTFQLDFPKSFYSTCKTSMFKFLDSSAPVALPDLFLGNNHLSYNSSARFQGLIWDKKLIWFLQITHLKAQCNKYLSLLRSFTNQNWGAYQYCCLQLYQMYFPSKLDYDSIMNIRFYYKNYSFLPRFYFEKITKNFMWSIPFNPNSRFMHWLMS